MSTFISAQKLEKHRLSKYSFKSLDGATQEEEEAVNSSLGSALNQINKSKEIFQSTKIKSSIEDKNSKEGLTESFMKKTDEISSNLIKLQMKLKDKEREYAISLKATKIVAYKEGLNVGVKLDALIKTLKNTAKEFESILEVINREVDTKSSEVELVPSEDLVKDFQSVSKIAKTKESRNT